MKETKGIRTAGRNVLLFVPVFLGLYLLSYRNYLLFHSLAELYSIAIAGALFMFAWNTREYGENVHLVRLGIAYLFVAVLDTFHTLSYAGMSVFTDYDYYANQIWIAARGIESAALLVYSSRTGGAGRERYGLFFALYGSAAFGLLLSILVLKIFPICFVPGLGQTPFKVYAELLIMALLALSLVLMYRHRRTEDPLVFRYLSLSILLTIIGEVSFTIYISNYGLSNMAGHFLKIASFYLVYKAIIETGMRKPLSLLFVRLKENEERLREADAFKTTLFSIISHDLKGPVGGMKSLSALLLEDFDSIGREELKRYLDQMGRTSAQTLKLLEDLLAWSRSQGKMAPDPRPIAAAESVRSAMETVSHAAAEKEISLIMQENKNPVVFADAKMIETVFRNILSNAIKFTPRGGSVRVSFSAPEEGYTEVHISDTGVGIPQSRLKSILSLGRSNSTNGTENEQGNGLGLVLCRELVEKCGGSLSLASVEGEGTTAIVRLPSAARQARLAD